MSGTIEELTARIFTRAGEDRLSANLEQRYGIRVASTERLDVGVHRLDHDAGPPWVARLYPAARPLDAVEGDAAVLRHLEQHGFPAERCAHDEPVSVLGDEGVLVTEFVEGAPLQADPASLRALGELIGRLHALPAPDGVAAREAGSLHHWSALGGGPDIDLRAAGTWLGAVEGLVRAEHLDGFEALRAALDDADACEGLPRALIHPDPVLKNAIRTPEGGVVLIDWTGAGGGPRLLSLAGLLWDAAVTSGGWEPSRVDAVVEGYRTHVELAPDELVRLAGVLRVRPLVLACFQFAAGIKRTGTPATRKPWAETVTLADALGARARDAFRTPRP